MNERAEALKRRCKEFALAAMALARALGDPDADVVIRRQLLRSATGTAANYRAACRSRSRAEFIARIAVALEEADEAGFWLELVVEAHLASGTAWQQARSEADQLSAIFAQSRITALAALRRERELRRQQRESRTRQHPPPV